MKSCRCAALILFRGLPCQVLFRGLPCQVVPAGGGGRKRLLAVDASISHRQQNKLKHRQLRNDSIASSKADRCGRGGGGLHMPEMIMGVTWSACACLGAKTWLLNWHLEAVGQLHTVKMQARSGGGTHVGAGGIFVLLDW